MGNSGGSSGSMTPYERAMNALDKRLEKGQEVSDEDILDAMDLIYEPSEKDKQDLIKQFQDQFKYDEFAEDSWELAFTDGSHYYLSPNEEVDRSAVQKVINRIGKTGKNLAYIGWGGGWGEVNNVGFDWEKHVGVNLGPSIEDRILDRWGASAFTDRMLEKTLEKYERRKNYRYRYASLNLR